MHSQSCDLRTSFCVLGGNKVEVAENRSRDTDFVSKTETSSGVSRHSRHGAPPIDDSDSAVSPVRCTPF